MPSMIIEATGAATTAILSQVELAGSKMHDKLGIWLKERPMLLMIAAFLSVGGCCYVGQILARYSKTSNIELNKFYLKKRFEK